MRKVGDIVIGIVFLFFVFMLEKNLLFPEEKLMQKWAEMNVIAKFVVRFFMWKVVFFGYARVLLSLLDEGISYITQHKGRNAVRMGNRQRAQSYIQINYFWNQIYRFLRLYWVRLPFGCNIYTLLAILFAADFDFEINLINNLTSIAQERLKMVFDAKNNWVSIFGGFTNLTSIVVPLVVIVFYFYKSGRKSEARRVIESEFNQEFKEVVLQYKKLLGWINRHDSNIDKNFDYVIGNQRLIVANILNGSCNELSPAIYPRDKYYWRFIELSDVEELKNIVMGIYKKDLERARMLFGEKKFGIRTIKIKSSISKFSLEDLKEIDNIEKLFYTKNGVDVILKTRKESIIRGDEKIIEAETIRLSYDIYDSLKFFYLLKRASSELSRYLYCSRIERMTSKSIDSRE